MRYTLPTIALLFAACGGGDDRSATTAAALPLGPDAVVLRMPMAGGAAKAYRYPALDTLVWTSRTVLPAQLHALAFNAEAGVLAVADSGGATWRLALSSGVLERASPQALGQPASIDGTNIFGTSGALAVRLTPTEALPWQVTSPAALQQLQPLRDGGVLLIGHREGSTVLTRFRPPSVEPVDSAVLKGTARLISAAGGDRYYLSEGPRQLRSVRARDLEPLGTIDVSDSIVATVSSPSGDRVYVLGRDDDEARVHVINKYADDIVAKLDVPTDASALRMDPLGRVLLVRFGGSADSVLVIAVANDAVLGRFASPWRPDLPLVFPDGQVAALRGDDVITLSALGFRATSVIAGGARDVWTVVPWNGFRRRSGDAPQRPSPARLDTTAVGPASAPDTPSVAPTSPPLDSAAPRADSAATKADSGARRVARSADSVRRARTDSIRRARSDSAVRSGGRSDTLRRPGAQVRPRGGSEGAGTLGDRGSFVVQFAALKAEGPAAQLASGIKANGEKARVVMTTSNGVALYRVILGPFRSRTDAERAGQATGRDFWVFEGGTN